MRQLSLKFEEGFSRITQRGMLKRRWHILLLVAQVAARLAEEQQRGDGGPTDRLASELDAAIVRGASHSPALRMDMDRVRGELLEREVHLLQRPDPGSRPTESPGFPQVRVPVSLAARDLRVRPHVK